VAYLQELPDTLTDPRELLLAYIDAYRDAIAAKLRDVPDAQLRISRVPSGWTPLELVKHLAYMERRWLQWGFDGEPVTDPWGDTLPGTERWHVTAEESSEDLLSMLADVGRRTAAIAGAADLSDVAADTARFAGRRPPTLGWILCHVLQEYARHVGHLDIVRELADGSVGE
jgi:hypothetical protein